MTGEITVRSMLQITKDGLIYTNRGGDFIKDMTTAKGPSPGSFLASVTGTLVDVSKLNSYGGVVFKNYDEVNKFEVGLFISSVFYPVCEVGPNEEWAMYFSENLGEQYGTAGTGTTGVAINEPLMVRSIDIETVCSIEIFER